MTGLITGIQPLTEEWHAYRKGRLTATKVAAILAPRARDTEFEFQAYKTELDVWAEVTGKVDPIVQDGPHLKRGRYLEPACAAWYADESGHEPHPSPGIVQDAEVDWLCVTPDYGIVDSDGSPGALECKAPGKHMAREWKWDVAPQFKIQLQTQLRVWGRSWGVIAALLADDLRYMEFQRHDKFIEWMMNELVDWREKYWLKDIPPPAIDRDMPLLRRLHPNDNGKMIVLSRPDVGEREWEITAEIKALSKEQAGLKATIMQEMGDNTYAEIGPEQFYSWRTQEDKNGKRTRVLRRTKKVKA